MTPELRRLPAAPGTGLVDGDQVTFSAIIADCHGAGSYPAVVARWGACCLTYRADC